jgi:preprotein translocase SecE subunit
MEKITSFIDKARNGVSRLGAYLGEVAVEAKRINWPGRQELKESTGVVIVFIIILAVVITICDFLIKRGMGVLHS